MISPDELEEKSRQFEINVANVQRDYVLGWLLYAIFTQTALKDTLFLKGGNALRKCYFPETRYSSDIDLGTPYDIDPKFLSSEIIKACGVVSSATGIQFKNEDIRIDEKFKATNEGDRGKLKVFEVRLYFKEFYTGADHIRIKIEMDVTRFDRTILPIQSRSIFHPYSDAVQLATAVIRCAKAEEILASKLKCILQREHAPDLFDVVYPEIFAPGFELNKSEILLAFLSKTIFRPSPAVAKNILLKMPFDFFRAYWSKTIVCARAAFFDVEVAIQKFGALLDSLFAGFTEAPFSTRLFFSAELRVPIMKAARTQTLLKVIYKGSERVVEPYSLKYLEPRAESAREYLFVWNRSGGSQSEPGLRMFVADNFQSIENTEEKFDPRYEIELCKAGEPVADPLLYDPAKQPSSRAARSWSFQKRTPRPRTRPRHAFRCTICNRLFYKTTFDGSLGEHKGKSGTRCYGRFGVFVKTTY
jgi:predicted nucleotidyltransferase component of viral defense system